jgi:hypothetical protein
MGEMPGFMILDFNGCFRLRFGFYEPNLKLCEKGLGGFCRIEVEIDKSISLTL